MANPPNTRRGLLSTALALQHDGIYSATWHDADPVMQNVLLVLREWGRCGAQSVQMPETYVAGLMLTDAHHAITPDTVLPWPAFEIVVPPDLLVSPSGTIFSVLVAKRPPRTRTKGSAVPHDYFAIYFDENASACHTYETLAQLVQPESLTGSLGYHGVDPEHDPVFRVDETAELRIWQCIGRLVGGCVLAIENARAERRGAFASRAPKLKQRGGGRPPELRANTWALGKPLKLDLRPQIREFVSGRHSGGGVPSVRTMVRGHWKRQFHGPGRALRKNIEIAPYFRGEGPALIRGVELRDRKPPEGEG